MVARSEFFKVLLSVSSILAFVCLLIPGRVSALSECQRLTLDSNVRYFNCEATKYVKACGSTSGGLTGSENDEKIWNYLIGKGLTAAQAAGVMGNFQAESGFDPTIVQGGGHSDTITIDGETGYGIAQWTSLNRQQALFDFATQDGQPATFTSDLLTQLDFMYMESNTGSLAGSWDALKEQDNVPNATVSWHNKYENSADTAAMIQNRVDMAEANFAKFSSTGGTTTSPPGSTACSTDGSGQVVAGYSLPVDRHWYDEHPDWFSLKHHDYPAVDIPVPEGTNVYSVSGGTIVAAPVGGDCGEGVIVRRDDGAEFKYCHGTDGGNVTSAKKDQVVKAGQLIMHSGNTGDSTGPHLHFEIVFEGTNRCPGPLLDGIAKGTPPEVGSLPTSGCIK